MPSKTHVIRTVETTAFGQDGVPVSVTVQSGPTAACVANAVQRFLDKENDVVVDDIRAYFTRGKWLVYWRGTRRLDQSTKNEDAYGRQPYVPPRDDQRGSSNHMTNAQRKMIARLREIGGKG